MAAEGKTYSPGRGAENLRIRQLLLEKVFKGCPGVKRL